MWKIEYWYMQINILVHLLCFKGSVKGCFSILELDNSSLLGPKNFTVLPLRQFLKKFVATYK